MNTKINHIKNLIHFAYADGHLHDKELEMIKKVGTRLGLTESEIQQEIENRSDVAPPLPVNEVLRYILFEDILHIIIADAEVADAEIAECKRVAEKIGFETEMVVGLISKMKEHIENGFISNTNVEFLQSEMYNLTINKIDNARYH